MTRYRVKRIFDDLNTALAIGLLVQDVMSFISNKISITWFFCLPQTILIITRSGITLRRQAPGRTPE